MQRMSLRAFCRKYGTSYDRMREYCRQGLLPHTGGSEHGRVIELWDEDTIAWLRERDKKEAAAKAAEIFGVKQAEQLQQTRCRAEGSQSQYQSDIIDFKAKMSDILAKRRGA